MSLLVYLSKCQQHIASDLTRPGQRPGEFHVEVVSRTRPGEAMFLVFLSGLLKGCVFVEVNAAGV